MDEPRVLLICDNKEKITELREKLVVEFGFSLSAQSDASQAVEDFKEGGFDVVLFNFDIANIDKPALIKELRRYDPDAVIIAFARSNNLDIARDLEKSNIFEFLTEPINDERLLFIIKKGAELHAAASSDRKITHRLTEHNLALQKQNTLLARRIEESTKNLSKLYEDLRSTYLRTIKALAHAIDARDHYTHSHSESVTKFAEAIASQMGLSAKEIEIIREASELHDLGKIGIQDSILTKPSGLTAEEWELMRKHPETAAQILEPLTFLHGVIELIRQHHEHFDGSGYPQGLKGEEILLGARILHLADAYEAMTSARSYRKRPFTKEEAITEIKKYSGAQFDPKVVEAFLKIVDKL